MRLPAYAWDRLSKISKARAVRPPPPPSRLPLPGRRGVLIVAAAFCRFRPSFDPLCRACSLCSPVVPPPPPTFP